MLDWSHQGQRRKANVVLESKQRGSRVALSWFWSRSFVVLESLIFQNPIFDEKKQSLMKRRLSVTLSNTDSNTK